jgi:hypothetical protein
LNFVGVRGVFKIKKKSAFGQRKLKSGVTVKKKCGTDLKFNVTKIHAKNFRGQNSIQFRGA